MINIQEIKTSLNHQIVINKIFKLILTIKYNQIYRALINNYTQTPTSITKWKESYSFLEIVVLKEIYQTTIKNIEITISSELPL